MSLNPFAKRPTQRSYSMSGATAVYSPPNHALWLFSHPTMADLAKSIAQRCSQLQNPSMEAMFRGQRTVQCKQTVEWQEFADGFPNLFIQDVKEMAGKDVIFLCSFHSPAVIFEQLSIIYAIPRYLARSFTLILPYFPTGTMERVDKEGQIATAKTLATLLSSTPLTARGPSQIVLFDIHALQERFYFTENVIPRLESAIPLLTRALSEMAEDEKLSIAFPDDGAFKRFSSMFSDMPTIVCFKRREGDKRIVKVKEGDAAGCHVVIVDDLVQTGGTLIECAKALYAQGANKVSAYVTHAVFPKESWKRFLHENCDVRFENFWITDSLPHAIEIKNHPPFRMLSLADAIADVLFGYDMQR